MTRRTRRARKQAMNVTSCALRDDTIVQRRQVRRTTIRSYLSLLGCGQEAKHNLTESHELLTIETAEIEQRWDRRWRRDGGGMVKRASSVEPAQIRHRLQQHVADRAITELEGHSSPRRRSGPSAWFTRDRCGFFFALNTAQHPGPCLPPLTCWRPDFALASPSRARPGWGGTTTTRSLPVGSLEPT